MTSVLKITTFHRFTVSFGDREWRSFRTDKVRALLLYLAIADGAPQRREHLATLFWPESDEKSARTNLRVSFLNLRKQFEKLSGLPGEHLFVSDRHTIQMLPTAFQCDVLQIQQVVSGNSLEGDGELAWLAHLATGISSAIMPGFNNCDSVEFDDWMLLLRENLQRSVVTLLERMMALYQERNNHVGVAETARKLLAIDAWREATWQALFLALGRNHDFKELDTAWERCRVVMKNDLGVVPSEQTVQAYRAAKLVERSEAVLEAGNLPQPTEAFFGRTEEHDQIVSMFKQPQVQLATILGAGGMGKSRLSREVGHSLQTHFVDGVWFITFAGSQNDDFVSIIGDALSIMFHGGGDSLSQLINALKERNMLLILDNFEDVLDDVPTVLRLLDNVPELKILCTSREALEVSAEWLVPLSGLRIPEDDNPGARAYGCIKLFERRAQQSDYRFKLNDDNLESVIGICRYVSGSPLGIELAAAWMRNQNAPALLKMMQQSPDVLQTKRRDVPERQRSMRTIFMHTWENLELNHRDVLARLCLFSGSFSAEEADAIAAATYFDLAVLSDKALLQVEPEGHRMHPLVRSYSAEHLSADNPGYARFSHYYLEWGAQQSSILMGLDGRSASRLFSQRYENMATAWKIALQQSNFALLESALGTFVHFWHIRARTRDGIELMATALKKVCNEPDAHQLIGLLHVGRAQLLLQDDQYDKALEAARAALTNGNEKSRGWAQLHIGTCLWQTGRWNESEPHHTLALETFEEQKDWFGVSRTLTSAGISAMQKGDYGKAHAGFIRALDLSREFGDAWGHVYSLIRLCILARRERKLDQCREWGEAALRLCTRTDNLTSRSAVLNVLAELAHDEGQLDEAISLLQSAEEINRQINMTINSMFTTWYLGRAFAGKGNEVDAEARYNLALSKARALKHSNWESQILLDMAQLKMAQDDCVAAKKMVKHSLQLAETIGNEMIQGMARDLWEKIYKEPSPQD